MPDDSLGPIFWMTANEKDLTALGNADVLAYNASLLGAADAQTQADARSWLATRLHTATPQDPQTIAAHLNERSAYPRPARAGQPPQLEMLIRDGIHTCPPGGPSCGALAPGSRAACPAHALSGCGTFMWTSSCLNVSAGAGGAAQCGRWSVPQPSAIPDAQTKMKTAALPDGRIYLLGSQVSNTTTREFSAPPCRGCVAPKIPAA